MLKLRIILLYDWIYYLLASLIILVAVINYFVFPITSKYKEKESLIVGTIINVELKNKSTFYTIKTKEKILAISYLENDYNIGDIVEVEGMMEKPLANTIFNGFNYKNYLKDRNIFWLFKVDSMKKVGKSKRLVYKLKNFVAKQINKLPKSKPIIKAFIEGDKSLIRREVKESYSYNGISHLLAVSGAHVAILAAFLLFVMKKINEEKRYLIVVFCLFLYCVINNFSPSLTRAFIFFLLLAINKIFYFHIKTFNLLLLTLAILILFNNKYLFDIGFQYSFIISGFLILSQDMIVKGSDKIKQSLLVSLVAFISSLPLTIYYFSRFNLLTIIYNLFYGPYVALILYPLSIIGFFLPKLDFVVYYLLSILERSSLFLKEINIFEVIVAKPHGIFIFLYYWLLYTLIKNKKNYKLVILGLLFFINYNYNYLVTNENITMIDIGQGDSFLISSKYLKTNILVDTGGNIMNKDSNIAKKITIPYLRSRGIRKIDILILTHGDYDHLGEAINLIENFRVDKIILNSFGDNSLERKIMNLYPNKIYHFKDGNIINVDSLKFEFLSPTKDSNENDESLVFLLTINGHRLLATGDASLKVEKELLKKYNLKNIEILKIGHHGSKTSSCEEFIKEIAPQYALISVGRKNLFNHPSPSVIERLKENHIKIYQTNSDGSVYFEFKKNKIKIKKCLKNK